MFIDDNGNSWDTAQEALDDFLSELPYMPEDEQELIFQFTHFEAPARLNLQAIQLGIDKYDVNNRLGGYPVPYRALECLKCGGYTDRAGYALPPEYPCGSTHESDCEACGNSICDLSC